MSYLPRTVTDILDEFNCDLDAICKELVVQREENEELKGKIEELEGKIEELERQISELQV